MTIYVCIDDTDNIDSIGTGQVADYIKERIYKELDLACSMTTRHQLYIHDDIPYTSHNSSMCFEVYVVDMDSDNEKREHTLSRIKEIAISTIEEFMAEGSDPGLCIASDLSKDEINRLIAFGFETKSIIKNKKMAYSLAEECHVYLTELGGTGDGIIGAIAGVGLRLSGNDGEVKAGLKDLVPGRYNALTLLARKDVQAIVDIKKNTKVTLGDINFDSRGKSVLRDHLFTIYVYHENNMYVALKKSVIRQMELNQEDNSYNTYIESCLHFKPDVDEERLDEGNNCANCSYRRWTSKSYLCIKGIK